MYRYPVCYDVIGMKRCIAIAQVDCNRKFEFLSAAGLGTLVLRMRFVTQYPILGRSWQETLALGMFLSGILGIIFRHDRGFEFQVGRN